MTANDDPPIHHVEWDPVIEDAISSLWTTAAQDSPEVINELSPDSLGLGVYEMPVDSLPGGRVGFALGRSGHVERTMLLAENVRGYATFGYESGEITDAVITVVVDETTYTFEIGSCGLMLLPTAAYLSPASASPMSDCAKARLKTALYGAAFLAETVYGGIALRGALKAGGLAVQTLRGGQSVVMPVFETVSKGPSSVLKGLGTGYWLTGHGLFEGISDLRSKC